MRSRHRSIAGLSDVDLTKGLFFFGNRLCPFAHRAWWALHEKGAASKYTYIHIELGDDKPAWYKEVVNPQGTVPCVYDGGKAVFESALVVVRETSALCFAPSLIAVPLGVL